MSFAESGYQGRFRRIGGMVADMLLPPLCLGCGEAVVSHGGVCASCWRGLTFIEPPVCPVLGTPLPPGSPDGTLSAAAIAAPPPFARLRAPCRYDRTARRLVTAFKYGDRLESASLLTRLMVRAGHECIGASDICVPVPLHWSRLLARRYNQAAEMSRAISAATGLDYVPHALRRIRATKHQVGLKQPERAECHRGFLRSRTCPAPDFGETRAAGGRRLHDRRHGDGGGAGVKAFRCRGSECACLRAGIGRSVNLPQIKWQSSSRSRIYA